MLWDHFLFQSHTISIFCDYYWVFQQDKDPNPKQSDKINMA